MKKTIKTVGVILGIILGSVLLTGCGEETVNLNECVDVKISGIDEKGKAEVEVDYDKMENLLAKAMKIDLDEENIESFGDLGSAMDDLDTITEAEDCVEFQVEPSENLKNGDKVTVKAVIDEETAKDLKIKFKFDEIEKKVEGLQEAIKITQEELFKDIVVEFVGIAPDAEIQIRNTSKDKVISKLSFRADENSGLDKGDTVVVTADIPEELAEQGYVFESASKEYKVEDVDAYVKDFKEMPEEGLKKIMKQAADMIEAQLLSKKLDNSFYKGDKYIGEMNHYETMEQPQLTTSYFYTLKEGVERRWTDSNALNITYTFDVTQLGSGFFGEPDADYQDCYISITCRNMILSKEGELQFDIDTMEFSKGYASFDSFYTAEVSSLKDSFEIAEVDLSSYQ